VNARSATGILAVTSIATFMAALDNLVVTFALPTIRIDLHASVQQLEWTVNAYTFSFAVLLITGAALGDRYGRKRVFLGGLALFTAASAGAALSTSIDALLIARAFQGLGGAIITPLSLTMLSEAFPVERRGLAIGLWSGVAGLAVAVGPVVGGAIVTGIAWQWIFWVNVPIGVLGILLGGRWLRESHGPNASLDPIGVVLASAGLFGLVFGVIRGSQIGWSAWQVLASLLAGALLTGMFVLWQGYTRSPMLPLRFFRSRGFSAINLVSLLMYLGLFGSLFLLSQYLQVAHGYSALGAGARTLPWTAMPMLVAPVAGPLSERVGCRPLVAIGLLLQAASLAWLALVLTPTVGYGTLVLPMIVGGLGMGVVFPLIALVVLDSVDRREEGQASGANNAIRELGGVFGVAVLATIFLSYGGYSSADEFTRGLIHALWVGAAIVLAGTAAALAIPGRQRLSPAAVVSLPSEAQ